MNTRNKLRTAIGLATMILLLVGCSTEGTSPAATLAGEATITTPASMPEALAATLSPVPPTDAPESTSTSTPEPTDTPEPPVTTSTNTPMSKPEPTGVTISGAITNLEDMKERYLAEDSYLQLVRLPADGRLSFTTDYQGRLAYDSELAQTPIPLDGVFTFQVNSLEPGTYVIAAQLLRASSFSMLLLMKEAEYVTVEIPQHAKLPLTFDLGEVAIQIP